MLFDCVNFVIARGRLTGKRQVPTDWIGKEIGPGMIGLINHGGKPKLLTKPGRYPGFPLRNWWARSFQGMRGREWRPPPSSLAFWA